MSYQKIRGAVLLVAWILTCAFFYSWVQHPFLSKYPTIFYIVAGLVWHLFFTQVLFIRGISPGLHALIKYRSVHILIEGWKRDLGAPMAAIGNIVAWPFVVLFFIVNALTSRNYKTKNRFWLSPSFNTDTLESIAQSFLTYLENPSNADDTPDEYKLPTLPAAISYAKELISKDSNICDILIFDCDDYDRDEYGNWKNLVWIVKKSGEVTRTI